MVIVSLYTNKNKKGSTIAGGIISLLILLISIALFFTFGQDFLYRLNPTFIKIVESKEEYTRAYFNSSTNYTLVSRFEDADSNLID